MQVIPTASGANLPAWVRLCANTVNELVKLQVTGVTVGNSLTFNSSGSGAASGTTFDGSDAVTISYNTIGAQPAGSYLTANQTITLSGDVAGSGATAITTTLANSGVSAGTYGDSTHTLTVTVDAKGRITAISTNAAPGGTTSAIFEDQRAANTAGGGATSGAWTTRTLNTTVYNNITSASLSSNQISLPAGTYEVEASGSFFQTERSRNRLRDVTNNVTLVLSENAFSAATNPSAQAPKAVGRFTLTGTATIELQYRVQTTKATNGLGTEANFGEVEVYARVKLTKVA